MGEPYGSSLAPLVLGAGVTCVLGAGLLLFIAATLLLGLTGVVRGRSGLEDLGRLELEARFELEVLTPPGTRKGR